MFRPVALVVLALLLSTTPTTVALEPLRAPGGDDALARALVAHLPRATAVNDLDGDKLFDDLERAYAAAGAGPLPTIVSFRADVTTEEGVARVRELLPHADVKRAFRIIPAYAGELALVDAIRLARLPEVRQIELSDAARPELETATAFMGADAVVDEMGVDGAGITIAILDTGFDVGHADLAEGKVVHFVDIPEGKEGEKAYDDGGHGTHVASIAAGLGRADPAYRGVAPGASILGLRIGSEDDAIAGYEYIVENRERFGVRIATMSFGFGVATDGTTALERAVDAAWDAGIVCFKSNGNSGPDRATMTVPAAARGILGIGSMLDPDGDAGGIPLVGAPADLPLPPATGFILSSFSSRGPTADGRVKPDLVAPGQAIMAAEMGTSDGYVSFSGTSMASPFAAGATALVLQANPALAPDQVKKLLFATAEDWGIQGPDVDYGHGRLRVREAVRAAFAMNGTDAPASAEPVVPFHEVRAGVAAPLYEGTVEINDTTHPIAATFIAEGTLLAVEVRAPDGVPVGSLSLDGPGRQQTVGFVPETTGTYAFRVVGPPTGVAFVVDFSHGVAPELPAALPGAVGDVEGLVPAAAADEGARVPGAPLAVVLGVMALAALVARRRT